MDMKVSPRGRRGIKTMAPVEQGMEDESEKRDPLSGHNADDYFTPEVYDYEDEQRVRPEEDPTKARATAMRPQL